MVKICKGFTHAARLRSWVIPPTLGWLAACLISATRIASAQVTDQAAIRLTQHAAALASMPFDPDRAKVKRRDEGALVVTSGEVRSYIAASGQLQSLKSYSRAEACRLWDGQGETVINTEEDARACATTLAATLGWELDKLPFADIDLGNGKTVNPDTRGTVTITFFEKPHGYHSVDRNFATLTFDRRTREVVSLIHKSGVRYRPPNIRLTAAQAAEKVAGAIASSPNPPDEIRTLAGDIDYLRENNVLLYAKPNGGFRSVNFSPNQEKPLSYQFIMRNYYVLIDAETGECRGGFITKTPPALGNAERRPPVALITFGGLLVIAIAVAAVRFLRH